MRIIAAAGRWNEPDDTGTTYLDQGGSPDLSVGTYCLRAGATDPQAPHSEDEVYAVVSGRARFTGGSDTVAVGPGTVLFVPAHEPHRFHEIVEDLTVLVLFGPAYGSRADP